MTTVLLLLAAAFVPIVLGIPDYSDLPGAYCNSRPRGCCSGRQDSCSFPILGTLCYCDDFCDRQDREDCCPDFYSHCRGVAPEPIRSCQFKGKYVPHRQTVKDNCNMCKCEEMKRFNQTVVEMLCERDDCMIEPDLLASVNTGRHSLGWHAHNHTDFWGRKLSEGLTLRLGTLQPHRTVLGMVPVRRVYEPRALPKSFSAETRWPRMVQGVKDQGWCGASWAISTAAVASDRYAIMSNGDESVSLSSQQLLSCNNRGQQSCNGGYLDRAWLFLRKIGVVDESCYQYHGKNEKCRIPKRAKLLRQHCDHQGINPKRKHMYKMAPAYRLGNETDIMYEMSMNGPVQATMKVYQDFFAYKGGIYKHSGSSASHRTAYHSVRIVGWGEEDNRKYWKVANSWGKHWGEEGYFRIVRGTNECDIETFVLGAWAQPVDNTLNEVTHQIAK